MISIVRVPDGDSTLLSQLFGFRYQVYINESAFLRPDSNLSAAEQEFDPFDPYSSHFVALDDGNIVGCARVVHDKIGLPILSKTLLNSHPTFCNKKNVEIGRLMVNSRLRGSPIALRLMRAAFDECLSSGCDNIVTDVFKGDTTHKMLLRMGFQSIGEEFDDCSFARETPSLVLFLDTSGHTQNESRTKTLKNLKHYHDWLQKME
jgi:predicted GNAT family N-acyltransferase